METQFLKDRVWGLEGLRILLLAGFTGCPGSGTLLEHSHLLPPLVGLVLPLRPTLKNVWWLRVSSRRTFLLVVSGLEAEIWVKYFSFSSFCVSVLGTDFSSVTFAYMFSLLHATMKTIVYTEGNKFYVFKGRKRFRLNVQSEWEMINNFFSFNHTPPWNYILGWNENPKLKFLRKKYN